MPDKQSANSTRTSANGEGGIDDGRGNDLMICMVQRHSPRFWNPEIQEHGVGNG